MNSTSQQYRLDDGFTLLEALIALVVISIALLGLFGLQSIAIVNTQTSEARSLASIAADDIADRIRANPTGAQAGNYDAIADPGSEGAPPSGRCADKCLPAEMAALDAWEWGHALHGDNDEHGVLPNGKGYVDCTTKPVVADPCQAYTITIGWSERKTPESVANNASASGPDFSACHSTLHDDIGNQCFITVVRP